MFLDIRVSIEPSEPCNVAAFATYVFAFSLHSHTNPVCFSFKRKIKIRIV